MEDGKMEPLDFVFSDRALVPGYLGLNCQAALLEQVRCMGADKILLVTEENVDAFHGDYWAPLVDGGPPVEKMVLPAGDEAKSWEHLHELIQWNFAVGATKSSVIVAFGGGALLNVAHLFASIAFRGMKLVSVPTTFLAMHDVVTSLKTSICYDGRKNNIGTFYAPQKILIDVGFCRTLPPAEICSGLGELVKNACLFGREHCSGLVAALEKLPPSLMPSDGGDAPGLALDIATLYDLTLLGIKAKMEVLAVDAYEKMCGMVFEYGHTISHAIEKAYGDGVIPHGLGVSYGMLCCAYVAHELGFMSDEDRRAHDEVCHMLLSRWPLPSPRPSAELVTRLALKDSKRGIAGEEPHEISDVLLHKIGDVMPTPTSNLFAFDAAYLREWLHLLDFPSEAVDPVLPAVAPSPSA